MGNENQKEIYIQSKEKVLVQIGQTIHLKDLIDIYAEDEIKAQVGYLAVKLKEAQQRSALLISMLDIIQVIKGKFPDYTIQTLGGADLILSFRDKQELEGKDKTLFFRLALVCFILFIGSVTAIVNFHSDVNMDLAHQTIYEIVTGEKNEAPLLMQIPYSFGIGAGMAVFFNHIFSKRINQEPTPLEVEMFLYQQNIDTFIKASNAAIEVKDKRPNG